MYVCDTWRPSSVSAFSGNVKLVGCATETPGDMFWWFERKGELLRVEVLQISQHKYELRVIAADGSETTETFSNAQDLAKRQEEIMSNISKDGWSGPHGWII